MRNILTTKHGCALPLFSCKEGSVNVLKNSKTINVSHYPVDIHMLPEHCTLRKVQREEQEYFLLTAHFDSDCEERVSVAISKESGEWLAENFTTIHVDEVES